MQRIAINTTWGGFELSKKAVEMLKELNPKLSTIEIREYTYGNVLRNDPHLIKIIESLGNNSSVCPGEIQIIFIPEDIQDWYIEEYDGQEWIAQGKRWRYDGDTMQTVEI